MSANTQALCSSFKSEVLSALHALGPTAARAGTGADTVKAALYYQGAGLGAATTGYSATNEVSGTGYTAGGNVIANANAPATSGTAGYWTPSAAVSFPGLTIASPFDCMELYNSTQSGRAIAILTFTAQTISVGTFTYQMPTNAPGSALITLN